MSLSLLPRFFATSLNLQRTKSAKNLIGCSLYNGHFFADCGGIGLVKIPWMALDGIKAFHCIRNFRGQKSTGRMKFFQIFSVHSLKGLAKCVLADFRKVFKISVLIQYWSWEMPFWPFLRKFAKIFSPPIPSTADFQKCQTLSRRIFGQKKNGQAHRLVRKRENCYIVIVN